MADLGSAIPKRIKANPSVDSSRLSAVNGGNPRQLGIALSTDDVALVRELVKFAIEQLTETLHRAERRPIAKALERYRDAAAELLERLQ